MINQQRIKDLIHNGESQQVEFKHVLPPSKSLAKLISGFANSDGGTIIIGVSDSGEIIGLSSEFSVSAIVSKSLTYLSGDPVVKFGNLTIDEANVYIVNVSKHDNGQVLFEGKVFIRNNTFTELADKNSTKVIKNIPEIFLVYKDKIDNNINSKVTPARRVFIDHLIDVVNIIAETPSKTYPHGIEITTDNSQGKILLRILFSSCADNFETYLSNLLYQIYLAVPNTLKGNHTVTVSEVLGCTDIEEFIVYYANQKIGKLQKGSVKGFIKDNKQIDDLNVFSKEDLLEIERILQIRHLYSHRNGLVDEKFLKYFRGEFEINSEHILSVKKVMDHFEYLSNLVSKIDKAAEKKYNLDSN